MFGLVRATRIAGAFIFLVQGVAPLQASSVELPTSSTEVTSPSLSFANPAAQARLPPAVVPAGSMPGDPVAFDTGIAAAQVRVTPTLEELVGAFVERGDEDEEHLCLAKAVYFEARGESLQGQLAVAEVILNRAASRRYPSTICKVVTQPAQFSFVRRGRLPRVNRSSAAWRIALAIADVARKDLAQALAPDVLWYHASYVSPSWGRRLTRVTRIGTHIFYS